jgi:hypothetical protein
MLAPLTEAYCAMSLQPGLALQGKEEILAVFYLPIWTVMRGW